MKIPYELFYLSLFLFAALTVNTFYRACRDKERFNYIVGGLCLLGFAWSIMFVLNQVLLAGVFWVVAMIFSVVMLPELEAFQDRRMGEVDFDSPLRVRELFSGTYSGWLKLAYRHGLGVTVILYFLLFEVIVGGMLLALNLFYDLPSVLILSVMTTGIFSAIRLYRRIKRALT
jgi:FtsH-binding integral membrane protein